jgi:hypothetical protein
MSSQIKPMSKLEEIKRNIKSSHNYFQKNIRRYHEFMKFVFDTSISTDDETKLEIVQKPAIEFNILEAYLSRLRGEFSKQEPDVVAKAADGVRIEDLTDDFIDQLETVTAHLREVFFSASNDSLDYNIYTDCLAGGYSVMRVFTDYINEMSFEQNIGIERVFDPTLTGFDPLARESHKGDGNYCFLLIPKTREEFEEEFGKGSSNNMKFIRSTAIGGFNWSYNAQDQEVVLVAEYYEKVRKREKIAKLSNGHTILKKHYKQLQEMWEIEKVVEQMPIIIEERDSIIERIDQYVICETQVLSHKKTNFKFLPLVFVDGNSVNIRDNEDAASCQMTRPFVYHAKGVQRLKNFSGQTIAAEIENMVQHKFIVSVEAIPEGYEDAYKNVQQASTLAYNAFYKDNPEVPLAPPIPVQRTETPPIVENTFMGTDRVTQTILGTYDSILGTNDKQISGVAIQQGALQANAAALPYLMGYIKGLNRVAQIIVDLIPKYYVTPRSLPIRHKDGKRSYQVINHSENENSIDMNYNPNNFNIKVEAGVSSGIQKQVAIDQIIRMMQASPIFADFINSKGLETILDNLDIRGIEGIKAQALEFMDERTQQAEAQAGQPSPEELQMQTLKEIEMAKVEQAAVKAEGENAVATAKVAIEKQMTDIKFMEAMAKIEQNAAKLDIEQERIDAENSRSAVETAISFAESMHKRKETT